MNTTLHSPFKKYLISLLIVLTLGDGCLFAQRRMGFYDPSGHSSPEPQETPIEEFRRTVHPLPPDYILIDQVFDSQRIDLLTENIHDWYYNSWFHERLWEEPSSDFKNQIVLILLRQPWELDPPVRGKPWGLGMPKNYWEVCQRVINRYLPAEAIDLAHAPDPKTFSLQWRKELSDRLQIALEADAKKSSHRPSNPSDIGNPSDARPSERVANRSIASPDTQASESTLSNFWQWLVGGLLMLGLIFGLWKLRQTKAQS